MKKKKPSHAFAIERLVNGDWKIVRETHDKPKKKSKKKENDMNTIYKYDLGSGTSATFKMPIGAKVLCAQNQMERICIWAKVDNESEDEEREFIIIGTGNKIPDVINDNIKSYVGTVQIRGGEFVFHVFELNKI
jgi:hypothetical protein